MSGIKETNTIEVTSQSAVLHVLKYKPTRIQRIQFHAGNKNLSPRLQEIFQLANDKRVPTEFSPNSKSHEPITAFFSAFPYTELKPFLEKQREKKNSIILALDHLQDPQNFGALCRTAEALGVSGVLIPKDRGVTVTAGVYNASVGAIDTLPIVLVSNLGEALRKCKDEEFWIVGTSLGENTKSPQETPAFEKFALVLGTEFEGLSPSLEKICDWLIQIPLAGKIQSLNVSVAGALLMYHFTQRSQNPQ